MHHLLLPLLLLTQAVDTNNSAACIQRGGYETNPIMQPLSHSASRPVGGFAVSFAVEDIVAFAFTRHNPGLRKAAEAALIVDSVRGIVKTGTHCH